MRIAAETFRGESPKTSPRLLPDNAAQLAINCRLQTGDLESWRQFLLAKTLANAGTVQTIYLLNGAWLSWNAQVDVARGVIPGDDTFRTYLTSPGFYATPRFTNYAMATTGVEPFPVATRPLGVPPPDTAPTLTVGTDPNPLTFSVDVTDAGDGLGQNWIVSSGQENSSDHTRLVFQDAGQGNPAPSYTLQCENNEGNAVYFYRDFGIANTMVATISVDVMVQDSGGNDRSDIAIVFGADAGGSGCRIGITGQTGTNLGLYINTGSEWAQGQGSSVAQAVCTGAIQHGFWYTIKATKTAKSDGTSTVAAELYYGATLLGTCTATNNFDNGGYCGAAYTRSDDRFNLFFDNFHIKGSGSTNYVAQNVATSYVYTFVNDLAEESPPSPASATVLRPDGISVNVTTPTTTPVGTDAAYGIATKRIYRAVTGATGTIYVLVDEIALSLAVYVDTKDDSDIASSDPLASDDWDLPPPDLQGIIALPNAVMAGFRRNQLCLSAAGRPHAWPVAYRLNVDTDIVAIANIDNTIVIGTKSFLYTATGNSPDSYSMSKPGDPQACVSKRSMTFMPDVGVVYASPDGLMVCGGSAGQVTNVTAGIFTKRQWQALQPSSLISAVHDGVLFFFVAGPTPDAGYALDTKQGGFGLIRLSWHANAVHVDPLTDALYALLDVNSEPTDSNLPLPSTAVAPSSVRVYQFDAGASDMVFLWRGKLNLMAIPTAMQVMQVRAAGFENVLVRLYGDGAMLHEQVLSDMREFTIPTLDAHDDFELELMGTSTVRGAQAAEEVEELR